MLAYVGERQVWRSPTYKRHFLPEITANFHCVTNCCDPIYALGPKPIIARVRL
jgi:hypothetical protein